MCYSEVFDELCPYYLSIGMSYDLYWQGDVCAVRHFRKADKLRQKRRNTELWLQGLYVYEAIGDMTPVLRPFAKNGTKPVEYPSEPYALNKEDIEAKRKREREAKTEALRIKLKTWAAEVNKKFTQEEVKDDAERTDGANRHRDNSESGGRDEKSVISEPVVESPEETVGGNRHSFRPETA